MRLSFWLLPSEPAKGKLQQLITDLAGRFDAPVFAPHVTLYSGPLTETDRPNDALANVASRFAPLDLHSTGISFSSQFTKTLFIEFALDDSLKQLSDALRGKATTPIDYELKPHMSLIYAELDEQSKRRLKEELFAPSVIRFDAIAAMISGESTRTRTDVENWKVSDEYRLAR